MAEPESLRHDSERPIVIHATVVNSSASTNGQSRLHGVVLVAVDLLKSLTWPLLVLTFFLMFHDAIRRTLALVPAKLEKADKGNVGSLSWEIQQHAREKGGGDLALRVGLLSPSAIEILIGAPRFGGAGLLSSKYAGVGESGGYVIPFPERINAFRELESAQLIRCSEPLQTWLSYLDTLPLREDRTVTFAYGRNMVFTKPLTPEQQRRVDSHYFELTPKGKQAVEAIVKAISEQLSAS